MVLFKTKIRDKAYQNVYGCVVVSLVLCSVTSNLQAIVNEGNRGINVVIDGILENVYFEIYTAKVSLLKKSPKVPNRLKRVQEVMGNFIT